MIDAQNKRAARYEKLRRYSSRALDLLCFVVGPMLIAANVADYLNRRRYYSSDSGVYLTIGVGLLAIGFLRIYWAKKNKER